jgi:broad specificity phosphatase PhoE
MVYQKYPLLFCARHGTTTLNSSGCYRGGIDVPLDKAGRRDANHLAFFFSEIEIYPVIYLSDRKRTRETAHIIGQRKDGIDYLELEPLRALNLGHLSGQKRTPETEEEIEEHVNNPDLDFEGGESLNDFRGRVRPLINEALICAQDTGLPVMFVVHSSIIHELGEMFEGDHNATLVLPGGVACVYIENGRLNAEPVLYPDTERSTGRHEVIS